MAVSELLLRTQPIAGCTVVVETTWNGLRAAEIRVAAGMTPIAVARALETAPSNLMRWELPEEDQRASEPRASVVRALSLLYGVACEEFYREVGARIRWTKGRTPRPAADEE